MKKSTLGRLAIRIVGVCFAVLGLVSALLGCLVAFAGVQNWPSLRHQQLYIGLILLLLGVIVITVAWQALRHSGPEGVRKVVGLLVFALFIPPMSLVFSNVDYARAEAGRTPVFSFPWFYCLDGGTTVYEGLGYSLTIMHRGAPRDDHGRLGYTVGPVLEFSIPVWPFKDKQHTWAQYVDEEGASNHPVEPTP